MRGATRRRKLWAAFLLGLFVFAIVVWIADWYVDSTYRHVVVEVSNVAGAARLDVNCRRAEYLEADEIPKRVDLGWLGPEDRIYLSEYNERGAAAWGFKVFSDGEMGPNFTRGHAGVTGAGTGPYFIAMAQLIAPAGDRLGTIGCALPGLVSDSVANYQQAPEMQAMLKRHEGAPPWDPPRFPFALIDGLAVPLLLLLATVGVIVALSSARVRQLIRRHRFTSFAVGALNLFLGLTKSVGPEALLVWFTGVGLILLLVSAVVAIWPHTGFCCLTSCSTPDPKPNPE